MKLSVRVGTTAQTFSGPLVRIGRSPECELSLGEAGGVVSWEHACFVDTTSGVVVRDLLSTNGTFLNGVRVAGDQLVRPGDRVRLGQQGPVVVVAGVASELCRQSTPPAEPAAGHATQMVRKVMAQVAAERKRTRSVVWLMILGCVLVVAGAGGAVWWAVTHKTAPEQTAAPTSTVPATGKDIYKQMLNRKSVVFIVTPISPTTAGVGTGCLIDKGKKQILTAYHVIGGRSTILVVFPRKKTGSEGFVDDPKDYLSNKWYVEARVVRSRPDLDLALLEVGEVPGDAEPLSLAASDPEAGDAAHTVGNPKVTETMWAYVGGRIRKVERSSFGLDEGKQVVSARVLKTDMAINNGDSGGPVVNERGELIGVNCAMDIPDPRKKDDHVQTSSTHIALSEVRDFLK
jgi:S1-C subfamily serine protease